VGDGVSVAVKVGKGVRVAGAWARARASREDDLGAMARVVANQPKLHKVTVLTTSSRLMISFQSRADTSLNWVFKRSSMPGRLVQLDIPT
jgi:hypothetical protein